MTKERFESLLEGLARAWHEKQYEQAASFFAENVAYGDPTRYTANGRDELLQFFKDDEGYPQHTTWHNVVFDEAQQIGAVEYTYIGTYQYHGIVIAKVKDDMITHWREYQHISDQDYETFARQTLF
jgi:SnoaL-like domain